MSGPAPETITPTKLPATECSAFEASACGDIASADGPSAATRMRFGIALAVATVLVCAGIWMSTGGDTESDSLSDSDLDASFELLATPDHDHAEERQSGFEPDGSELPMMAAGHGLDLTTDQPITEFDREPALLADRGAGANSNSFDFSQAAVSHGPLFSDPLVIPQTPGVADAALDSASPTGSEFQPARYQRSRSSARPEGAAVWLTGSIEFGEQGGR